MANAAMVVAHPDDETLWGAGWILTHPEDRFTVICCSTPRLDPERVDNFFDACEVLGAMGMVLPNKDHPARLLDLSTLPDMSQFEYVVTHNHVGEYGNKHHIQVSEHVQHLQRAVERAGCFDWPITVFGRGLEQPSITLRLTPEQWTRKMDALQCYSGVSPADRTPKWQALIDRYFGGDASQLATETYVSRG